MNQYKVTLLSGSRMIFGDTVEKAFKTLGYPESRVKFTSIGLGKYKKWEVDISSHIVGHESKYYITQVNLISSS